MDWQSEPRIVALADFKAARPFLWACADSDPDLRTAPLEAHLIGELIYEIDPSPTLRINVFFRERIRYCGRVEPFSFVCRDKRMSPSTSQEQQSRMFFFGSSRFP